MYIIILGGLLGFAIGNLAGTLFGLRNGSRPIDAIRQRLERARADADRAADRAAESIRERFDAARRD
jgi:hypothetical protein